MWKWLTDAGQTPERYAANPISSFTVTFYDQRGQPVYSGRANVRFMDTLAEDGGLKEQEYGFAMKLKERFRDALYMQALNSKET